MMYLAPMSPQLRRTTYVASLAVSAMVWVWLLATAAGWAFGG